MENAAKNDDTENRFSLIEVDDVPAGQPVNIRINATAPVATPAPAAAYVPPLRTIPGKQTVMGAVMSTRMNRFYTFLADQKIGIGDFSTDVQVQANKSALRNAVEFMKSEVERTNGEVSRRECLEDLEGILRRVPENRVQALPVAAPPKALEVNGSIYTAVKDVADSTGSIIFWRLTGEVTVTAFNSKLTEMEIGDSLHASPVTPGMAFLRAVEELRARDVLVRRHPAGGFLVVEEITENKDVEYRKCCRVFLDKEEVKCEAIDYTQIEAAKIRDQVEAFYSHALKTFSHSELSAYLVSAVRQLKGVTFTRGGGFYYLAKKEAETFAKIQAVVEGMGASKIYLIPIAESKAAVRAVFDAVALEIGQRFDEMQNELNVGTGKRAATNRLEELAEVSTNIKHYEQLLGADFKALKARREELVKGYRQATGEGTEGRGQNLEID